MTTTPERRTATLSELVAQEIDSVRGRRRMSQAQLARAMGKTPMWVSLRLRGLQPIDMNDLLLFARALDVEVHDLMPSRERAAEAEPPAIAHYFGAPDRTSDHVDRPRDNRAISHPGARQPAGPGRTAYLPRVGRRRRD